MEHFSGLEIGEEQEEFCRQDKEAKIAKISADEEENAEEEEGGGELINAIFRV